MICYSTTAVLALARPGRPPEAPSGVTVIRTPGVAPRQHPGATSVSSGVIRGVACRVEGRTLHLSAEAWLRDIRPEASYVWFARILRSPDPADVAFFRVYDDRVFRLPPEQESDLAFQDSIELDLEPGVYRAEVALDRVPPGDGLAAIRDPARSHEFCRLRGAVEFVVGGP